MKFSTRRQRRILIGLCALLCVGGVFAQAKAQSGPAVGETVDLLSFRSRSGQTLAEAVKKNSLTMLVLVDPNCSTCTSTKDSMNALRGVVEKTRISYFVVMILDGSDPQKYFDYADSLKLGADSLEATGTTTLLQKDFGITPISIAGVIKVKNELPVTWRLIGRR